jgi:2-dehydropantoate 2-reductase
VNVLIIGAGAVGGFLADRLAHAGDDVTVLVRPTRADQLRSDGLRTVEAGDTRVSHPHVVTAEDLARDPGSYELVVIAVKADALDGALADVAPAVGPQTRVLPFLNGMRHVAPLRTTFGDRALGGVLRIATDVRPDGAIDVIAPVFEVELGAFAQPDDQVRAIADRLTAAGADVVVSTDIEAAMWTKWAFIASIGALTSLMRATVGEIVAAPGGASLGPRIVAEVSAIARAAGHPLAPAALTGIEGAVTAAGSPLTSSLSRDQLAGRVTEVEPVLGDLIAQADVEAPLLSLATLALRVHNRRLGA